MKTTQELKELLYKNKTVADQQPDAIAEANAFCEGYKAFLNAAKTEREAAAYSEQLLKQAGYKPFVPGMALNAGDKVYLINRSKCVLAATIGERSMAEGFHLNIAHIDSPRLDLRPVPLFEKDGLAYFRTHYYGGIRKYQWPTIPLALHGVVCREDGTTVTITIGENDEDPVFTITDLLPHLGREQNQKKLPDAITAENLNVVLGSLPIADADAENRIKLSILGLLNEMYGITERDFVTAEIEIVPAFKARDVGLDRSMIGAYGHDDRVDAYPALMAEIEVQHPAHTTVCILTDKEEVGSDGVTGMIACMPTTSCSSSVPPPVWIPLLRSRHPSACLPMLPLLMIPASPKHSSRITAPMRAAALQFTNTPVQAERALPAMPTPNWSAT